MRHCINYIRHARASLKKAVEWEYVHRNPLAGAKELPDKKRVPSFIKKNDIGKFLKSISDVDLRRMVVAYIVTGRRRSELLLLEWGDIDTDRRRYTVRHSKSHRGTRSHH